MQKDDSEAAARRKRVQQLCQELTQLVTLSAEQRRTLQRLLAELESLKEEAEPLVKRAGKS